MPTFKWAVIGAGPAGIAAIGNLLDQGIKAEEIAWIDPHFTVGDFGTLWRNVPSNTKVGLFLKFLHACDSFNFKNCSQQFALSDAPSENTCALNLMSDPLQWVTDHLLKKVKHFKDTASNLKLEKRIWKITLKNSAILSKNVILAIGAEAKKLAYPTPEIPLYDAMDSERIKKHLSGNDTIAVFGSSHSAILVLRNLVENSAKKIINFYRSSLLYAVYLKDYILFDDTGLKGPTADWAHQFIDGELPANLQRIYSNEENIEHYLPQCDKAIYAVGFERRTLPTIDGLGHVSYIEQTGIIAPGLFGFGIAFPELKMNPIGLQDYRVGLWKFMEYIQRVLPIWQSYEA